MNLFAVIRTPQRALLCIAFSLNISASQAQSTEAAPVLNAQAIRAHAEFLGSDLLEGRATGARGYDLAAAYVAAQFRQSGLQAPGDGTSYLQAVPLIEATVVLPGSTAALKRDGVTTNFEFSKDYLPAANFFNANSAITAPLAFAGYAIDAPEYKYNDFADLDLQGHIAVIFTGAPDRFNPQARSYYGWRDTKYANLVKQGALGVIEIDSHDVRDVRGGSHWDQAVAMSWVSEMRLVNGDEQAEERFPELKLKFRFNSDAASQLLGNGHSLEQSLQLLKSGEAQSFALPGAMTLSATTGLRRVDSNNVLGLLRGADPRLQNEYVLVIAHLDHLGRGPAVNGDSIYNGLQRNAIGVAMMLDMARSMAALPTRPKRSILFAAVTAGEKGAQGLQYLLTAGPIPTRNIVAAMVLDTPLPITRSSDVLSIGTDQSSMGSALINAATQHNLRVVSADEQQFSLLSDTLSPLVRAHIPALSLQGGVRARDGRVDVRSLRREFWRMHVNQPSDDLHTTPWDSAAARELASLNVATVLQLANAADRPAWYRTSLIYRKLSKD
jgi:hypothetical protein